MRAAQDPHDSRVALRLMRALDASGNRAGALRHAAMHRHMVQQEFGIEPAQEVLALAERLRHEAMARSEHHDRVGRLAQLGEPRDGGITGDPPVPPPLPAPSGRRRGLASGASVVPVGVALILAVSVALLWAQVKDYPPAVRGASAQPPRTSRTVAAGAPTNSALASVAVLAFEDLSPEADQAWFADGIAEEILSTLSRIDGLYVSARPSSFAFRGPALDTRQVGEALGVRHLLVGSIRRGGDSVWVTTGLVDAASGFQLWSETYARVPTVKNLRGIQSEIAREVATALELQFRPGVERESTVPAERTYEAYLEGRYYLRRVQTGLSRDRHELLKSVDYFREVVEHSPRWAPGWAALGEAHHWVGYVGIEPETHFPESKRALLRALELDPTHAQANASLGFVLHRWDLDFEGAEAQFKRALELDTGQYWHCGYTLFLLWAERYGDAIRASRRAEAHDPLYRPIKELLATSQLCAGRFADAIVQAEHVLALHPNSVPARRDLVLALERSGRAAEALARLDQAPETRAYWDLLRALVHARAGRRDQAEALIRGLSEEQLAAWAIGLYPSRRVIPAAIHAATLVALGQRDTAVEVLQAAMERDPNVLLYDRCYAELESLEGDARYQELLRQAGIGGR